uniref:F-box domain-containing protein n=1 Tax=Parascaris univalens TaxID=6257 RepID=A0A915A5W2_PARUN
MSSFIFKKRDGTKSLYATIYLFKIIHIDPFLHIHRHRNANLLKISDMKSGPHRRQQVLFWHLRWNAGKLPWQTSQPSTDPRRVGITVKDIFAQILPVYHFSPISNLSIATNSFRYLLPPSIIYFSLFDVADFTALLSVNKKFKLLTIVTQFVWVLLVTFADVTAQITPTTPSLLASREFIPYFTKEISHLRLVRYPLLKQSSMHKFN